MKTTIFKKAGALLITMLSPAVLAAPITVDFTITDTASNNVWGTGSFTGEDSNITDGLLTFDELTSFDGSNNTDGSTVNLSNLFDIGDYDIVNNIWLPNGIAWEFSPEDDAFFTWNERVHSVNAYWASATTVSSVPIPAAAWLFGSALLGLGAVKRRKA